MSFDLEITNSDLRINPDGSIRTITDTPKLRQDVIKIVLTPLGSNRHHQWYGCTITDDVVGRDLPEDMLMADITESIESSLFRLKQLQGSQTSMQDVSLSEMIAEIGPVIAQRNRADPRQINIIISVFSRRLVNIEEVFTVIG